MNKREEYLNNMANYILEELSQFGCEPSSPNIRLRALGSVWHNVLIWFNITDLGVDRLCKENDYKLLNAFINDAANNFVKNNPPLKGSRISKYEFSGAFPFVSKGIPAEPGTTRFEKENSNWELGNVIGFYIDVTVTWRK